VALDKKEDGEFVSSRTHSWADRTDESNEERRRGAKSLFAPNKTKITSNNYKLKNNKDAADRYGKLEVNDWRSTGTVGDAFLVGWWIFQSHHLGSKVVQPTNLQPRSKVATRNYS
jgi:hypothetical protein